jgi:hypothetical protein
MHMPVGVFWISSIRWQLHAPKTKNYHTDRQRKNCISGTSRASYPNNIILQDALSTTPGLFHANLGPAKPPFEIVHISILSPLKQDPMRFPSQPASGFL